jgi:hypothetical protein
MVKMKMVKRSDNKVSHKKISTILKIQILFRMKIDWFLRVSVEKSESEFISI